MCGGGRSTNALIAGRSEDALRVAGGGVSGVDEGRGGIDGGEE